MTKRNLYILPVIISLMVLFACSKSDDLSEYKLQDLKATWLKVKDVYPYLEYKNINWDSLYYAYKPMVEESQGNDYIELIYQMLCELKDGHVGIKLKNGAEWGYSTARQIKDKNAFDLTITQLYLDNNFSWIADNIVGHATINNKIEYLYIKSFMGWNESLVNALTDTLSRYENFSDLLIIDVRHNGGGNSLYADKIISHLLSDSLKTPGRYYLKQYYDGIYIVSNPPKFDKKIVVLTNGKSFSSTEHFVMNIQQIDNCTIIGDTTGGGSGNPKYYALPSGIMIRVSTTNYLKYDGKPIEWNGIVPDILIPQTEADIINKTDKQIEYAIEYLLININQ